MDVPADLVDKLAAASGLAVGSRAAAAAAWAAVIAGAKLAWPTVKIQEAQLAEFIATRIEGTDLAALAHLPARLSGHVALGVDSH